MDSIKHSRLFRVISTLLITTFISLDITFAYPSCYKADNSTLSTPSLLQAEPVSGAAARLKESILAEGPVLASVFDIGEYFFNKPGSGAVALPQEHADEALRVRLGEILDRSGIEILNIVPVEYLQATVPDKLAGALDSIGFRGTLPAEGVVFILYKKGDKKFLVQVARTDRVSPDNIPGYDLVVSGKYIAKYVTEDYAQGDNDPAVAKDFQAPIDPVKAAGFYSKDKFEVVGEEFEATSKGVAAIKALLKKTSGLVSIKINIPGSGERTFEIDLRLLSIARYRGIDMTKLIREAIEESVRSRGQGSFKGIKDEPIMIALLDRSQSIFEDHQRNNFIGINRALFDKSEDAAWQKPLETLLKVGITHELRHEAGESNEAIISKEDARLTYALAGNSTAAISAIITLLDPISAMGLYVEELVRQSSAPKQDAKPTVSEMLKHPVTAARIIFLIRRLRNAEFPLSRNHAVAMRAEHALIDIGEPAVSYLISALSDKDPYVRGSVAYVLGEIGPKAARAIPALTEALKDAYRNVRDNAEIAVDKIGGEIESIYINIMQILKLKKEIDFTELFTLVESRIPGSMPNLKSALSELKPLSLQADVGVNVISAAIFQAKERYGLSRGEVKILWLALTGPGQGGADEAKDSGFILGSDRLRQVAVNFRAETESRGKTGSSLSDIVTELGVPTGREKGKYLFIDLGGTNLRVGMVEFNGDRTLEKKHELSVPVPLSIVGGGGDELFRFIAAKIKSFTEENKLSGELNTGFTFSFAMKKEGVNRGIITPECNVKGYDFNKVMGQEIVTLLNRELAAIGSDNVKVVALVNDTEGVRDTGAYLNGKTIAGGVFGTGHNTAIRDAQGRSVNLESGAFDKLALESEYPEISALDAQVDALSKNPGVHLLEKKLSGKYVGPLFGLKVEKEIRAGKLFAGHMTELPKIFTDHNYEEDGYQGFTGKHVTDIEKRWLSGGASAVKDYITGVLGISSPTDADAKLLRDISYGIMLRSAQLGAATFAGIVMQRENTETPSGEYAYAVDGSLLKHPGYIEMMKSALADIFGAEYASKLEVFEAKDGAGIGAAITAMIVSTQAAQAATEGGVQAARIQALIQAFDTGDPVVAATNVTALAGMGDVTIPYLIRALESTNGNIRRGAAETLGRLGPGAKAAVEPLAKLLVDADLIVQITAVTAVGRIGPDARSAIPALTKIVKRSNWILCDAAILALGDIGPDARSAVPEIRAVLVKNSVTWFMRRSAAEALGKIGPDAREAVPDLLAALKETDSRLRKAAAEALNKIAPEALNGVSPDASTNNAAQLFEIVESAVNTKRAEFISAGNRLIGAIPATAAPEPSNSIGLLDKDMASAEIKGRVERAIAMIGSLSGDKVSAEAKADMEFLTKNLNQFEANGAIGALIGLARKAKKENQNLIIGLETDWIPAIKIENSLQRQAITALMKEIDGIAEALQSMGLDNVRIIRGSGAELASAVSDAADKTRTSLRNVVVMASVDTINSESFNRFRLAEESEKPFLAGIDPTEIMNEYAKFGEDSRNQLYIRLAGLLYMTLDLAAGKEPPKTPIIINYDRKMRLVIFMPKAELIDYEALKSRYMAEKTALQAA